MHEQSSVYKNSATSYASAIGIEGQLLMEGQSVVRNNTIAAGYEKDDVVSMLLLLRDSGIPMDGSAMEGWALAHGWSGDNPARLGKYVDDINAGKRPRVRRQGLRADYIDVLRAKAAAAAAEQTEG